MQMGPKLKHKLQRSFNHHSSRHNRINPTKRQFNTTVLNLVITVNHAELQGRHILLSVLCPRMFMCPDAVMNTVQLTSNKSVCWCHVNQDVLLLMMCLLMTSQSLYLIRRPHGEYRRLSAADLCH